MARRRSIRKHRSRKNKTRSHRVRNTRRHRKHQRGGSSGCATTFPGGAACNAGSSSNYAITMVGDAFVQMKQAMAAAFS